MKLKRITTLLLAAVIAAGTTVVGCGAMDPDAQVASVNGTSISLGLANYMAQFSAVEYDTFYMSYFGTDMWKKDPAGSGKTMTQTVKDNTLEKLQEYYLLEEHMGDYGVVLTEEETSAIEAAAAQFMADNAGEAAEAMGATEQYVKEFLRLNTLQKKMYDAIIGDVDTNVPDEECAQKTFSYVRVSKTATGDDKDSKDEKQAAAEAKEKAQKILDAALLGSQEDPLEAAAKDHDANKLTCSYGNKDLNEDDNSTYLEQEVLQAAEKLGEGEFAKDIIDTENSYYVIRMDSLDDKEAAELERESIISERERDLYEETLNGYKESAEWTVNEKVWEPVNFDTIYSRVKNTDSNTDTNAQTEK